MRKNQIGAIILAGGLGTRLRSVVSDRPKVLAEVRGRAFLTYLLDQLCEAGFSRVLISIGYMADMVQRRLGSSYGPLTIDYCREDEPLGTGGALRLAMEQVDSPNLLVMNGDSFIDADLDAFAEWFFQRRRQGAMVVARVADTSRYGSVSLGPDNVVESFHEKRENGGPGWINAGIYLLDRAVMGAVEPGRRCSLERDVFAEIAGKELFGYCVDSKLIDIGTPESYAMAERFLPGRRAVIEAVVKREKGKEVLSDDYKQDAV